MRKFGLVGVLTIFMLAGVSCTDSGRSEIAQHIVINELMASNRTGLQMGNNKTADWIELKNTATDSVNLEGFELAVIKEITDSTSENELTENVTTWSFPSVVIGGGECVVIFADKGKDSKTGSNLVADLKLPKAGGTVQFLSPDGKVISEVKYGKLAPDQSLSLQSDSTYKATYWQSPGFENTREGYEAACIEMDDQRHDPLKIWEVKSRSKHSYENWVELKNTGSTDIDLSSYKLAKKMGKNEGWTLPERTLQPGQIITFQLAGKRADSANTLQVPFKLGSAETLVLTKDGKFIDGVCAKTTTYGGSIGRSDNRKGFFFYATPTRNTENGNSGRRFIAEEPQFDMKPGIYSKQKKLCLHLKDRTQTVHYTLDGSEPTTSSPIIKDSIQISRSTVIRTLAEGDSTSLKSNIATGTYLLGVEHNMPVINIAVNKSDLYDFNNGIYADGPGYTPEWPHTGANYWKDWTKKAHVEFFDDKEGFSVDCGLKIFGGFSRYEAKKSFRIKFRGEYGDAEVDYDFFGNGQTLELEDLVLRSGSQDYNRCMIRDEFFTSLLKEQSPTLLTQIYRPVALYVNAEYFGLYYIREKIDNNFVARQLNVSNDSINIIMSRYTELGSSIPYTQLMQFVSTHDMTNSDNYEYMRKNVDLQGLIDYKLGEIYSSNTDVGNIRYVRSTSAESDKKWHFVFYDLDATWVGDRPTAEYYLSVGGVAAQSNVTVHNMMINRLLANKEFRELFLQRLSHHMKHTFSTANATAVFDKLVEQIRPEMKRNCERWPQLSYNQWEKNIGDFRAKFQDKPRKMLNDLRNYLSITEEENKKYFSNLGF